MAAGMQYNLDPMAVEKEVWNIATIFRLAGGFNLSDDEITDGTLVPTAAPLKVDFLTRKAVVSKNIRVIEATTEESVTIKATKGSLVKVGMFLGTGENGAEIKAIDKSNADYDNITLKAALGAVVKKGEVLFQAVAIDGLEPKNVANFLNYTPKKSGPGETVTAVGQVFEIKESLLRCPVSEKDKEALGARFMFV